MAATFVGKIIKFEEDGVWLSPTDNLSAPCDYKRNENGDIIRVRDENIEFNQKGEFKLPYESPRVITPVIPKYQRTEDNIGKFCLYITGVFRNPNDPDDKTPREYIAVEIGDNANDLYSKWH